MSRAEIDITETIIITKAGLRCDHCTAVVTLPDEQQERFFPEYDGLPSGWYRASVYRGREMLNGDYCSRDCLFDGLGRLLT